MGNTTTSTVMAALTVEERADKADAMASLIAQIDGIKAQAKAKAFEFREAIEALQDQLSEIANVVRFGAEEKRQAELKFDLPTFEAKQALAEVGKRACSCEGGPDSDAKSPACPVHGVDAPAEVEEITPCDGNHALATPCADPECWQGTAEQKAELLAAGVEGGTTDEDVAEAVAGSEEGADPDDDGEAERVVDMAEHLRANAVDVGTVEEPETVKAHRARRARG